MVLLNLKHIYAHFNKCALYIFAANNDRARLLFHLWCEVFILLFFTLCNEMYLFIIIHSHSSINHHFYADDTQLYITLTLTNFSHSIQKLKNCPRDIQNFMSANKLKRNPEKTEFILIGSKNNRKQLLPHFPINILGNQVSPAQSVRNLGVVFDSNFSFSDHVSQVIKSTRVHARDLYRIRPLLDLNTSVLLANALVSSRLDYCNSLFLSLTDFELRRLQLVQNSLCRVVTQSSKYCHITPQLKKTALAPYQIQDTI